MRCKNCGTRVIPSPKRKGGWVHYTNFVVCLPAFRSPDGSLSKAAPEVEGS